MYFCAASFENVISRAERLLREERLLHESAVGIEHLDAIGLAIADVDEPIVAALDAMHGIAELLAGRRGGIVFPRVRIVGTIAVRAPVALHLAGIGIDHRDA